MNKHFSIVNRRSVVYVTIGMLLLIALLGVCLSFALKGSKLWFIGVVIFGGLLLFGVLIARSVLDAGIDVIRGTVILPDIKHPERGKVPAFHVADLEDVGLFTLDGKELDPAVHNSGNHVGCNDNKNDPFLHARGNTSGLHQHSESKGSI